MYSDVFIVNFEYISHLGQRAKYRNTCFILEKRKKSKFNRFQIEVFFLPNIAQHFLPVYKPTHTSPLPYRPFKFFLCPIYAQGVLTAFYGICLITEIMLVFPNHVFLYTMFYIIYFDDLVFLFDYLKFLNASRALLIVCISTSEGLQLY